MVLLQLVAVELSHMALALLQVVRLRVHSAQEPLLLTLEPSYSAQAELLLPTIKCYLYLIIAKALAVPSILMLLAAPAQLTQEAAYHLQLADQHQVMGEV
jgi:hypothetical protein